MTERQELFYSLYMSGYSMRGIAEKYKINPSTVCRTIARAETHIAEAKRIRQKFRKEDTVNRDQIYNTGESSHEEKQQPDIPEQGDREIVCSAV